LISRPKKPYPPKYQNPNFSAFRALFANSNTESGAFRSQACSRRVGRKGIEEIVGTWKPWNCPKIMQNAFWVWACGLNFQGVWFRVIGLKVQAI
jgi:hypothetical protein